MKLLRTFPKVAFEFGLASWQWLGLREQTPRFATCFGDIFLESLDGWWFLDTVEGTLELRWTSAVTMYAELESPEGRATYLMDDLVREARGRGIHLGEEDVYTFTPHPALGGELGGSGLGTMRFELAVNWVGQMHDQVLHGSGEVDLPPLPDSTRRGAAPPGTSAWDTAWARDETFDAPFEQYLATTTFAAVAGPRHAETPAAYPAPRAAALPGSASARAGHTSPWPGQHGSASVWSGQTDAVRPWPSSEPTPRPTAPSDGYRAGHQGAPDADDVEPLLSRPYVEQGRHAPSTGTRQPDHGAAAWGGGSAWPATTWSQPASPLRASPQPGPSPLGGAGGPQPTSPADDPFTAWDDLWGKH